MIPRLLLPTRLLLLSGLAALLTFSRAEAQQTAPVSFTEYRNSLEQEAFSLVNQYRKNNKLPLLQWDGNIALVARGHSKDMASGDVDFGHDGFNQRVTQLKTVMIGLKGAGENVLKTDDPDQVAATAVALWLKSPHHLANIRGDFNCSGLGVWRDDQGMIYFTQIFVKLAPQAQATQAAPPPQVVSPFGYLAAPQTR